MGWGSGAEYGSKGQLDISVLNTKQLKKWLEARGFLPMVGFRDHFWRRGAGCFSAIGLRSSGRRDGSFLVDLKVGLVDEFMPEQLKHVFAAHYLLNRQEVVYYTWSRHETWRESDIEVLISALDRLGVPHLEKASQVSALCDFLLHGLEHGHPIDPSARRASGIVGKIFASDLVVGKRSNRGVPFFGYLLGLLFSSKGDRDAALIYLREYRRTLDAPALKQQAVAVDMRIGSLEAESLIPGK